MSELVPFVPAERNGDVDWNTLGNILSAHILGEVRMVHRLQVVL